MSSSYLAPADEARAELRAKGSRFLAIVAPTVDMESARGKVEAVRTQYSDASHVCWACRVGHPAEERASDAGEPAGTAGRPILNVMKGRQISDVVGVVVRWFGGVKLGKGGLARAYAGAVKLALEDLALERRSPSLRIRLTLPYDRISGVKRLVCPPEIEIVEQDYGDQVRIELQVVTWRLPEIEAKLADLGLTIEPD